MLPFRGRFDSERHCLSDGEMAQTVLCEKRCFLEHYKVCFHIFPSISYLSCIALVVCLSVFCLKFSLFGPCLISSVHDCILVLKIFG